MEISDLTDQLKSFEPTDEDNIPAVDSLSPLGMFQFTVANEYPIRGVEILRVKEFVDRNFIVETGLVPI